MMARCLACSAMGAFVMLAAIIAFCITVTP